MRNLCLTLAYEGTAYAGWQFQPQVPTVQGAIEAVLQQMTGQACRLRGAARTDAGVHADHQLANVRLETRLSTAELHHGLNALLAADIRVIAVDEVPADFEARRDNKGKHYRYRFWTARELPLAGRNRVAHLYRRLDRQAMATAAQRLVGKHDFAAFRAADCDRETTVRTLHRCTVSKEGPLLAIDVEGTAFLKQMVRIIVGTLIDVGSGRCSLDQFEALRAAGQRTAAGMTAPAQGLTLMRIFALLDECRYPPLGLHLRS